MTGVLSVLLLASLGSADAPAVEVEARNTRPVVLTGGDVLQPWHPGAALRLEFPASTLRLSLGLPLRLELSFEIGWAGATWVNDAKLMFVQGVLRGQVYRGDVLAVALDASGGPSQFKPLRHSAEDRILRGGTGRGDWHFAAGGVASWRTPESSARPILEGRLHIPVEENAVPYFPLDDARQTRAFRRLELLAGADLAAIDHLSIGVRAGANVSLEPVVSGRPFAVPIFGVAVVTAL